LPEQIVEHAQADQCVQGNCHKRLSINTLRKSNSFFARCKKVFLTQKLVLWK